jgi:lipopolysaccharide export system permease protein
MQVLNRYILKNLIVATLFVAFLLSTVLILTQSLRFLELIIESGAGAGTFWALTFLALPRFFEVLMPLSVMIAVIFIYSRMADHSELVVLRTSGFSPIRIARPALMAAAFVTLFLWFVTLWAAPKSLSTMQQMRQLVKSQFSSALLRERVFSRMGQDITMYIQDRLEDGTLEGLMIHDKRDENAAPATILAKRGVIAQEEDGYKVIVYDGTRQSFDPEKQVLQSLEFERYTIDLPVSGDVRQRWQEPDERTVWQLLNPDLSVQRDADNLYGFKVELHRRITAPLLTLAFTVIAVAALVMGQVHRRGRGVYLLGIVMGSVVLQGLFIAAYNMAAQHFAGIIVMYFIVLLPILSGFYLLSGLGERHRRSLFYGKVKSK